MSSQDDKIRWLQGQLQSWVRAGVIDTACAESIGRLYPDPQSKTSRPWAMLVFSGIGSVVIGLGIILLFAYNWHEMSKLAKLAVIFGSLILAHLIGINFFVRSDRFKGLGEAITVLGTMLFGAGIWLIAQIYHIEEHFPNAFLFWGAGALLMAWTMPSVIQAVLAAVLLTIWTATESVAFDTAVPYVFVFLLSLFPLAYKKHNGLLVSVLLLAVGFSTLFVVSAIEGDMVFYALLSLSVLYTAIGLIHQKPGKFEKFGQIYWFWGQASYFLILFILGFTEVSKHTIKDIQMFSSPPVILCWAVPFALALAGWGIVGRDIVKKVKLRYYSYDLILMPLLLIFFCCYSFSMARYFDWPLVAAFNLVFLTHALMRMAKGCMEANLRQTAIGSLLLVALIIARFTDLFDSLAVRGLVFVVAGILIFSQGFFYVQSKKKKALQENKCESC